MGGRNKESYWSLSSLGAKPVEGALILTYHKLGALPTGVRMKSLYVSAPYMRWQCEELQRHEFTTLSLDDYSPFDRNEKRVVWTFDDGSQTVFKHALPLLREKQMRAIVYLVAGELGGTNFWDQDQQGEVPDSLMDVAQIEEWLASGQEIGAHTLTHPDLTKISLEQAREEIFASRKKLEDTFGRPVQHFCYPYGKWSIEIRDLVEEAGYKTAVTLRPGINISGQDPLLLKRWSVVHPSRSLRAFVESRRAGIPWRHHFRV